MMPFSDQKILAALLAGEGRPVSLGTAPSERFVEQCRRHRLSGLVHPSLAADPGEVPASMLAAVRETVHKTLVDNLILLKALHDTAAALDEEGIGFVLLKGASLLGFLYPEIQMRPMSDLDLLIREKDWRKVADTLQPRGYRLPDSEAERFYGEQWYHQLLETPGPPSCRIEIHWNLESVERSRVDPDQLIHDAVPCEIEGERFLRLCDDHLLLHLSVHLAHHYERPALLWVEDLRRLLRRGRLDWGRIRRTAREWGVENCLAYSLGYVERVFPGTLPDPAREFRFSPGRRLILRLFRTEDPALPHRPLEGHPFRHAVSMVLLDRWRDVARYVSVHSLRRIRRAVARPAPEKGLPAAG